MAHDLLHRELLAISSLRLWHAIRAVAVYLVLMRIGKCMWAPHASSIDPVFVTLSKPKVVTSLFGVFEEEKVGRTASFVIGKLTPN